MEDNNEPYTPNNEQNTENTVGNENISGNQNAEGQSDAEMPNRQNVYTVGSGNNGYGSAYVPPVNRDTRPGEYSYSGRDQIPDNRYTYAQPAVVTPTKKPKTHKGLIITLIVISSVLLTSVFLLGGQLLLDRIGDDPIDTGKPASETTVPQGTDTGLPSGTEVDDPAIIVKNDDSITVKTISGKVGDENLTIPDVVALVKDSVVEIFTETPVYNGRKILSGAGSGVMFSKTENGKTIYIVTNNHVVDGAQTISVRLTSGNEYKAKLIGTDSISDVAVLSIETDEKITTAVLGSSAGLVVGESVIAIGNPLGELGGTVTNGIISALAREVSVDGTKMTLLQTNAAINPGNSGGGLFNMKGELIAVVNAKSSGEDIDNLGFAIPIDSAYLIVKELMSYGYVTGRVDSGLTLVDVTDIYTAMYYGVNSTGVYVSESKYSDEIQSGDRIVSINGEEVASSSDIKGILGGCKVGDVVTVRISRRNKQSDVKLTLHEYVPETKTTD